MATAEEIAEARDRLIEALERWHFDPDDPGLSPNVREALVGLSRVVDGEERSEMVTEVFQSRCNPRHGGSSAV